MHESACTSTTVMQLLRHEDARRVPLQELTLSFCCNAPAQALMTALWFSVEVTQHALPPVADASAVSACTQRLRSGPRINLLFAHRSKAAREEFAASNPAYTAYLSSHRAAVVGEGTTSTGTPPSCTAEATDVPPLPAGASRESDEDGDHAWRSLLLARGKTWFPAAECDAAALTVVVDLGARSSSSDRAELVLGQHGLAWARLPHSSAAAATPFSGHAVRSVMDAAKRALRRTTEATRAALLAAKYDVTFFLVNEDPGG
jgi:hypothetical protein